MFIEVSYSLQPDEIVMPGAIDKPKVKPRSRMVAAPANEPADSTVRWKSYNNTSIMEFFAHTGTHIDVPFHVDPDGFKMHELEISDFIFEKPAFLEIPKKANEKIRVEDLQPHEEKLAAADIFLLYTGFSANRSKDPEGFVKNQPSFSVEAANYLVDSFNIRAYGIDTIGIENIPAGKAASPIQFPVHKILLLKKKEKTFVVEDMNLKLLLGKKISRFFVIPLRLYGAEGMPVTAFAEVED
jgi:arylformamidase